jgi:hypothetical protein
MLDEVKNVVKSVLRNEIDPMLPTQLRGYFRDLLAPLLEVSIPLDRLPAWSLFEYTYVIIA